MCIKCASTMVQVKFCPIPMKQQNARRFFKPAGVLRIVSLAVLVHFTSRNTSHAQRPTLSCCAPSTFARYRYLLPYSSVFFDSL